MRELYQVVEVGPAWYQDNIPCQEACPVRTNCRGYLNLAAAGEFEKAWELALDPNPMASICGSVCAAPCETACRRKEVDKPLSIRYVKKFLSDWTHENVTVDGTHYRELLIGGKGPWQLREHRGRRVRTLASGKHRMALNKAVTVRLEIGATTTALADEAQVLSGRSSAPPVGRVGIMAVGSTVAIDDVRIATDR